MASVIQDRAVSRRRPTIPPLCAGDRLSRAEFERRYEAMPNVKKAELIEGIVYLPSPARDEHSSSQFDLVGWLYVYRVSTPGVSGGDNGTLRLDLDNEPQPDGFLRILESHGGQARVDEDGYVVGAPELVAEVSVSSVSVDSNAKLQVYRRHGVKEYIVWRVAEGEVDWYILRDGEFGQLDVSAKGILKSEVFPGLWLDAPALLRGNVRSVFASLQKGLASRPHAAFVKELASRAAK